MSALNDEAEITAGIMDDSLSFYVVVIDNLNHSKTLTSIIVLTVMITSIMVPGTI